MDGSARRDALFRALTQAEGPITGSELARQFGVSRQVVVQDIAVLRAGGTNILATPQGYLIPRVSHVKPCVRVFTCRHLSLPALRQELTAMVSLGGKVVDTIVEHPIYGEFRGMLMLMNMASVEDFCRRLAASNAEPLSHLTGGVHLHAVEADTPDTLDRIEAELARLGILVIGSEK
ncbi:MAG: transcription repressor NadR [Christensenellales bacterium]|jgi:transcriptional regulator of NAD metabolism